MRRWNRWLLPVLTGLVALLAVALPQRLSLLRDGRLLGQVHTEALAAENGLTALPPSLLERMDLLRRWQEGLDGLAAASQPLEDREALTELAGAALGALADEGVFPPELALVESGDLTGERLVLQDTRTGAGASFFSASQYWKDRMFWLLLDEEGGQLLRLEIMDPLVRKADLDTAALGGAFFRLLGVEAELQASGPRQALFHLTGTELSYIVSVDDWVLGIRPTAGSSASVATVDGAAAAR